jgi:hypothetical protein
MEVRGTHQLLVYADDARFRVYTAMMVQVEF